MATVSERIAEKAFSATVSGSRHEVDHPDALAVNDGVALFAGPGGVPVIFDFEGVSEIFGDLSGPGANT